jgi:hypothetical protein
MLRSFSRILITAVAAAAVLGLGWWWRTPPSRAQNAPAAPAFAVRLTLGVRDTASRDWSGRVKAVEGAMTGVEGVRFDGADAVRAPDGWTCATHDGVVGTYPLNMPPGEPAPQPALATRPNSVLVTGTGGLQTRWSVETAQGGFDVVPGQLGYGQPLEFLDGAVRAERVPMPQPVSPADGYHDYPAIATDSAGNLYVSWVAYAGEQDQVMLRRFDGREWGEAVVVSPAPGDHFQTALAATSRGVLICYGRRDGSNWDLFTRTYQEGGLSPEVRLTRDAGPDLFPRLAADGEGHIYLVWQGFRGRQSDIFLESYDGQRWSKAIRVSDSPANDWQPAITTDNRGTVSIAWDTYARGNYDVCLRSFAGGKLSPVTWVASSPRFEAHPSLASDGRGGVWVAWDESGAQWGKDYGFLLLEGNKPQGARLYHSRSIRLALVRDGRPVAAADLMGSLPAELRAFSELPGLSADATGRLWVLFRHRTAKRPRVDGFATGGLWEIYAAALVGGRWSAPIYIPQSYGRNDGRSAAAVAPDGKLWLAWATDGRTFRQPFPRLLSRVLCAGLDTRRDLGAGRGAGAAPPPENGVGPEGSGNAGPVAAAASAPMIHPQEAADVARVRGYRALVNGRTYRIVRGDLHRHTDISGDGAGDGSLLDLYRYALDAARLDFILVGDHNAGNDQEYSWWRTQKSNDLFFVAGAFIPCYGYERSVPYPNGHRNLIFPRRGVRTLPLAPGEGGANPTVNTGPLLYPYLRRNDAIATSHTSATDQGTDWRDNDPAIEPVVELFQGYHTSYEHAGAPGTLGDKTPRVHGAYRPAGFVWNALAKGLRLGFQASSDHISTHMSYACVYVEEFSRQGLIDGIKKRHTYAATDNIVMDVRMGSALMGDDFRARIIPPLEVRIHGTGPIAQVDIIRNNQYLYTERPNQRAVTLSYQDNSPPRGTSYYYLRALQADGQMAWASPIWVTRS